MLDSVNEVKETKEKKERPVLRNPFCHVSAFSPVVNGESKPFRLSTLKMSKSRGSAFPVYEEFDLDAEIESMRNMCGMELMRSLLAQGKAKPEDFYDDGQHGVDTTLFPSSVHEARKLAEEQGDELTKLASALGFKPGDKISGDILEKALTAKVREIFLQQQQQASTPNVEGESK